MGGAQLKWQVLVIQPVRTPNSMAAKPRRHPERQAVVALLPGGAAAAAAAVLVDVWRGLRLQAVVQNVRAGQEGAVTRAAQGEAPDNHERRCQPACLATQKAQPPIKV